MKVSLRKRSTGKKISLYLDCYHNGKRFYEFLKLYLHKQTDCKLTPQQKNHNKEVLLLAESIRSKRYLDMQSDNWGFHVANSANMSFLSYLRSVMKSKQHSAGNIGNWESMLKHLKSYTKQCDVTFEQVTSKWLEGFKKYLQEQCTKKNGQPLSPNTIVAYFSRLSAALKQAVREEYIQKNPMLQVTNPKTKETKREFLTIEELKKLANTECDLPVLKQAFLFSALTGLRHSDIKGLCWEHIQHSEHIGYFIRFTQQKTQGVETLPISNEARNLLGEARGLEYPVFSMLQYSAWYNLKLKEWLLSAGILKRLTFHCARHTFATLQLSHGTDIFTVSKLLGHKNLKTTQVYAKVMDQSKIEAMQRIQLGINF